MKRPSFQFYPSDWLRDTALRSCSTGARGLWIDMICFMHEGQPYGHLKVGNKVILSSNLARMVGETIDTVDEWLDELKQAGVYETTEEGVIYSRRMIRDENLRQIRAAGGVKGGNPALLVNKDNYKVNLIDNLVEEKKDKQNTTPSSSSSSASAYIDTYGEIHENIQARLPNCEYQKVIDVYHECLPELSKARLLTKARERLIKQRWNWILTSKKPDGERRATNAQEALVWFENYFSRVRDNDFLMGRVKQSNDHKNWKCDIDFLMEDRGLKHVIEKTEG